MKQIPQSLRNIRDIISVGLSDNESFKTNFLKHTTEKDLSLVSDEFFEWLLWNGEIPKSKKAQEKAIDYAIGVFVSTATTNAYDDHAAEIALEIARKKYYKIMADKLISLLKRTK